MNEDFENGRRFQSLESSINILYMEIYLGSGKNNPHQQELLREKVKDMFNECLQIGDKYRVSPVKLKELEKIYYLAMDLEYHPKK